MEKEELLKKWLADELSKEETATFLAQDEGDLASSIVTEAKRFQASSQTSSEDFEKLRTRLRVSKNLKSKNYTWFRVAASVVIFIGLAYFLFPTGNITNNTVAGETKTIELPDTSQVLLNAVSFLTYNESSWEHTREVTLNGEAYFKVAKGKKFSVLTNNGIISVVGTQYNVKSRGDVFVVSCYEGSVKVESNNQEILLLANEEVSLIEGVLNSKEIDTIAPSWVNGYAQFENENFNTVLQELERQYGIKINYSEKIGGRKFTGRFDFNNLELALKEITSPMNLKYTISSKSDVTIYE